VPLAVCSFTKDRSSINSACDNGISLPGSATGAPGLSSMAWSHGQEGGNPCDASSENTLEYIWYGAGIFELIGVALELSTSLQMYTVSSVVERAELVCCGRNRAR
jgi:hypothetical protein